jgi:hypothetical protein
MPEGFNFNQGFIAFDVKGIELGGEILITYITPASQDVDTYFNYGPTPDDRTDHWYEFTFDGTTGVEIFKGVFLIDIFDNAIGIDNPPIFDDPDRVNLVVLHLVDGLRGDSDLTVDGMIAHPDGGSRGAPATIIVNTSDGGCSINPQASPRLPIEWLVLVAVAGIRQIRHQPRPSHRARAA